jgi:N-acetylglucosamine-6-phosphate deacetylase
MLVTDAMPPLGTDIRSFALQGRRITVNGLVCYDEEGRLAGSNTDLATCVRNVIEMLGLPLHEAVHMASLYPAEFLGLAHELGRIEPGYRANLVLADERINVLKTWIDGQPSDP